MVGAVVGHREPPLCSKVGATRIVVLKKVTGDGKRQLRLVFVQFCLSLE